MPPPLPLESETESVASDKTPTKADPSAQVDDELADAVMQNNEENEDNEDDDEEVGEDEYVVESIMDHQSDFPDNEIRYLIKWKGYEKKSDRTWETEENLQGARDILKEYWAKLGGKPIAENKSASKKRARQSRGSDTPDSSSTKKQKKAGRKSKDAGVKLEDDAVPDGTLGFTEVGDDDWKPPKVKKESWDDKVQSVDTIEKDDQGVLWAYLLWNDKSEDGRYYRSKAKLSSCKEACPQRMLEFYEKHVVFTNSRSSFVENGEVA